MKITSSRLTKKVQLCTDYRKFFAKTSLLDETEKRMNKVFLLRESIMNFFTGLETGNPDFTWSAVRGTLTGKLDKLEFSTKLEKKIETKLALDLFDRFTKGVLEVYPRSEWDYILPVHQDVKVGDEIVDVEADIHIVSKTRKAAVVAKVKMGKSDILVKETGTNPELRLLALSGHVAYPDRDITSAIWFLRRADDKGVYSAEPHFEEKFFAVGGRHVFEIVMEPSKFDEKFKEPVVKALNDFKNGCSPRDVNDSDCKYCKFNGLCEKAIKTPKKLVKTPEETVKKLPDPNPEQEEAISFDKGVLRLVAAAGSGKTYVIAKRVTKLIGKGVFPEEILLLTFTDAAAKEMYERLYKEIGTDATKVNVSTFNSYGMDAILKFYEELGFTAPPTVIDEVSNMKLISDLMDDKLPEGFFIEVAKVNDIFSAWEEGKDPVIEEDRVGVLLSLYEEYRGLLKELNYVTYRDQEKYLGYILESKSDYLDGLKHVMVDEYQDTSKNQNELLINYFSKGKNVESFMVIGDDWQSIYGFRDAAPEYMVNFNDYFEGAETKTLSFNYRSQPKVVDFASKIIANNVDKVDKVVKTVKEAGDDVTVKCFLDTDAEKAYVIETIKGLISCGTPLEDICYIASTKRELDDIKDLLYAEGIYYTMLNPEVYEKNKKIKAVLDIGKYLASGENEYLLGFLDETIGFDEITATNLPELTKKLKGRLAVISSSEGGKGLLLELFKEVLKEDELAESFCEVLGLKKTYDDIVKYLLAFDKYGENCAARRMEEYEGVKLCTAHSSKGLEWPVVIVSLDKFDNKDFHNDELLAAGETKALIEEKRRLFYVSATRAKDKLFVLSKHIFNGSAKDGYNENLFLRESYRAL